MDLVAIQASDSYAKLIFSNPEFHDDSIHDYMTVQLEDPGLRAVARVHAYMAENIAGMFEEMAEEWRGWEGERSAATGEHDLSLTCSSDSLKHGILNVVVISRDAEWEAKAQMQLDSNQYSKVAEGLRSFFKL